MVLVGNVYIRGVEFLSSVCIMVFCLKNYFRSSNLKLRLNVSLLLQYMVTHFKEGNGTCLQNINKVGLVQETL
jgi:hypothetical protein